MNFIIKIINSKSKIEIEGNSMINSILSWKGIVVINDSRFMKKCNSGIIIVWKGVQL